MACATCSNILSNMKQSEQLIKQLRCYAQNGAMEILDMTAAFTNAQIVSSEWISYSDIEVSEAELSLIGINRDYTTSKSSVEKLNLNLRNKEFREKFLRMFPRRKDSMSAEEYLGNSFLLLNLNWREFSITGRKRTTADMESSEVLEFLQDLVSLRCSEVSTPRIFVKEAVKKHVKKCTCK